MLKYKHWFVFKILVVPADLLLVSWIYRPYKSLFCNCLMLCLLRNSRCLFGFFFWNYSKAKNRLFEIGWKVVWNYGREIAVVNIGVLPFVATVRGKTKWKMCVTFHRWSISILLLLASNDKFKCYWMFIG